MHSSLPSFVETLKEHGTYRGVSGVILKLSLFFTSNLVLDSVCVAWLRRKTRFRARVKWAIMYLSDGKGGPLPFSRMFIVCSRGALAEACGGDEQALLSVEQQ